MLLKVAVHDKIMNEVILSVKSKDWKILVVDHMSTRILSSCCKMTEIMTEQITLVEDITKKREPLVSLEAIYFISPVEKSVRCLIDDFSNPIKPTYKAAHIFFTEACPNDLFQTLCKSINGKYIHTLKEINIAFLPCESQVFSLDCQNPLQIYYSDVKPAYLENCAEQIATLCSTLGEYPSIRYRCEFEKNSEFAKLVKKKLDIYKTDDPTMGEGVGKVRSRLLILDRGFDPISPLLHELTYQAMAYDLLDITNDVYKFESGSSEKEALLDENDDVWNDLRHQHIAIVTQQVSKKLKEFAEQKKMTAIGQQNKSSVRDISLMIKNMPQYQKELKRYSLHLSMAEGCLKNKNDKLCKVEQDLAMGFDDEGNTVKDPMKNVIPLLLDSTVSTKDKIRIILLYILYKGGESEENLNKLLQHAKIPSDDKAIFINMQKLAGSIMQEHVGNSKFSQSYLTKNRKEQQVEHRYVLSRWVPYIKDIVEDAIDDKLNLQKFPYLSGSSLSTGTGTAAVSARTAGQLPKERSSGNLRSGPRLIVFIMGGVSYSEIRSIYEIGKTTKNWDILIGSTNIITPNSFLESLRDLQSN